MKLSRPAGFTLIELLCATAVLAVLVAFAFSGIQGIAERRDGQICLSNLRQVYVLLQTYTADNNGRFPPASSNVDGDITLHWRRAILPYMGKDAGGSGLGADIFNTGLVCPTANRSPRADPAFSKLCNFGVNEKISDPSAPLERGIPVSRIRNPSRFFLATETIFKDGGLPRESIIPKDLNTYATQWGYHRKTSHNVLFADGHIEMFRDIRRLIMTPYAVGQPEDVWTP